jgi:hypothetical protein
LYIFVRNSCTRGNIRTLYVKYGKVYKVTKVLRNVMRSHISSDVRNSCTRGNIRTLYVKYGNSRKGNYIKKPYSNIRSRYLEQGKRFRLHRCGRCVYTEPVLREEDTRTHKRTVECTVSRRKQSGAERKLEDPVLYVYGHIDYSKLMFVGIGKNTIKLNTQCNKGYVSGKNYTLVKKEKRDGMCIIKSTKLTAGRQENCDKTVSEDYGILSVRSKMEAKTEDGPEMDVDGATPEGQNGKKFNIISSCEPLIIFIPFVQVLNKDNISTLILLSRIHIMSHGRGTLPTVNHYTVYACLWVRTRYLCTYVQSLAVISLTIIYLITSLLPNKLYFMISGVHRGVFRPIRYRE